MILKQLYINKSPSHWIKQKFAVRASLWLEFQVLFFIMESSDTVGVPTSCNILHAHYGAVLSATNEANEIQVL
jgi:hypothetical protein